jgi:hypothetical protein
VVRRSKRLPPEAASVLSVGLEVVFVDALVVVAVGSGVGDGDAMGKSISPANVVYVRAQTAVAARRSRRRRVMIVSPGEDVDGCG